MLSDSLFFAHLGMQLVKDEGKIMCEKYCDRQSSLCHLFRNALPHLII